MKKRAIPKSIKCKEHYGKVHRLVSHAERLLYCGPIEKYTGIVWTEEEHKQLRQAQTLVTQAEEIIELIFAARIGKQAVREARLGE